MVKRWQQVCKWWQKKWLSKISQNQRKCWKNLVWSVRHLSNTAMAVQLNLEKETVQNTWTMAQWLDSPPWQCSSSKCTLYKAVSGPKINYWNGKPILFHWCSSDWLLATSKNKVCLKERKISGYQTHPKSNDDSKEFQKCFQQWKHHWAKCIVAQGKYFKGDPSQ